MMTPLKSPSPTFTSHVPYDKRRGRSFTVTEMDKILAQKFLETIEKQQKGEIPRLQNRQEITDTPTKESVLIDALSLPRRLRSKTASFFSKKECAPVELQEKSSLSSEKDLKEQKVIKAQIPEYQKICDELISSELNFNRYLNVLMFCEKSLLEDANLAVKVFGFINEKKGTDREGLRAFGQNALYGIFEQVPNAKSFSDILGLFLSKSQNLEEFSRVIAGLHFSHFITITVAYEKYIEFQKRLTIPELKILFRKMTKLARQNEQIKTNLTFEDYAANLIQRLTRYKILIEVLLKEVEKHSHLAKEANIIKVALKNIQETAFRADNALTSNQVIRQSVLVE